MMTMCEVVLYRIFTYGDEISLCLVCQCDWVEDVDDDDDDDEDECEDDSLPNARTCHLKSVTSHFVPASEFEGAFCIKLLD